MPMRRCTTAASGRAIGQVDLDPFLGPCRVIHAIGKGAAHHARTSRRTRPRQSAASRAGSHLCDRRPRSGRSSFSAFAPETIAWLAGKGVRLVGIDSQSVDPADSKTLDSHQQLLAHDMRVLENLVLDDVPEGDYELIALPLKLTHACASPVRAVLRSLVMISRDACAARDAADPLAPLRALFAMERVDRQGVIYLDGNSLGVLPARHAGADCGRSPRRVGRGPDSQLEHRRLDHAVAADRRQDCACSSAPDRAR